MKKKNAVFEDIITTVSRYFVVLVVVVILCIAFSGIRFVKSGEVAVVLRFGKIVGDTREEQIHEPGILFAFPYIIDEVVTVPTGAVMERTITTYYTEGPITSIQNGYLLTGDDNIVHINASVKYTITDPVNYALHIKDIEKIIDACVSNAMLEITACTTYDEILTTGKEQYISRIKSTAQKNLDNSSVGITLSAVELTNITPPQGNTSDGSGTVIDAYNGVIAANVQAKTDIEKAEQTREQDLIAARATAEKIVSEAQTEYSQKTSAATSDLAEFWGTREEYERSYASRAVVRTRIEADKISKAIGKIGKIIVVKDGDSHIVIN